jgi:hypothetical protein
VLPGVTVTITDLQNGQQWTTTADAEGRYVVPLLPPGTYRVVRQREYVPAPADDETDEEVENTRYVAD